MVVVIIFSFIFFFSVKVVSFLNLTRMKCSEDDERGGKENNLNVKAESFRRLRRRSLLLLLLSVYYVPFQPRKDNNYYDY